MWLTDWSVSQEISVLIPEKIISYIDLVLPHFSSKSGLNTWPSQWIPFSKKKIQQLKIYGKNRNFWVFHQEYFCPFAFHHKWWINPTKTIQLLKTMHRAFFSCWNLPRGIYFFLYLWCYIWYLCLINHLTLKMNYIFGLKFFFKNIFSSFSQLILLSSCKTQICVYTMLMCILWI